MGALHAGHLSLVKESQRRAERTAVSIFVNPTQFGQGEDFARYPRTLETDLALLTELNVDAVVAPSVDDIYPTGSAAFVEPGPIAARWEGAFRPGHFRGVATVVLKFFALLQPDVAVFGEKDYQQLLVIRHMARDLLLPLEIVACPTQRESDGLAMSSRNRYLSPDERVRAASIFAALSATAESVRAGERDGHMLRAKMHSKLKAAGLAIDYATLADAETLTELATVDRPAVGLIAARAGQTRLIDNLRTEPVST
jgi:pantoate--beta-alanine ligase